MSTSIDVSTHDESINHNGTNDDINNQWTGVELLTHQFMETIGVDGHGNIDLKQLIAQCRILSKQLFNQPGVDITRLYHSIDGVLSDEQHYTSVQKFGMFELMNHCMLYSKRLTDLTYYNEFIPYIESNLYKYILILLPLTNNSTVQPYIEPTRKIVRMWQEKQYLNKFVLLNVLKYIDTWKLQSNDNVSTNNNHTTSTIQHTSPSKHKRNKLTQKDQHNNSTTSNANDIRSDRYVHQPSADEIAANKLIEDIRAEQKQAQLQSRLRPLNESIYDECDELWNNLSMQPCIEHKKFMLWFTDINEWKLDSRYESPQSIYNGNDMISSPVINTPVSPLIGTDTSPAKRQKHEMVTAQVHSPSLLRNQSPYE